MFVEVVGNIGATLLIHKVFIGLTLAVTFGMVITVIVAVFAQ